MNTELLETETVKFRAIIDNIIRAELEPLMIGECPYTWVLHQGKTSLLAERIRIALLAELIKITSQQDK